ncbi:hypothetical protein ABIA32_002750 [Streptacidiphilus sp. MAP12-20]|uniref:hypothetical protein n=1 Tax=Streptacidiphilus sp. MAP12-20 TaxID=3156299 RepID=UPI003515F847
MTILTCHCTGIRHAMDGDDRRRTRNSLDSARERGLDNAAHYEARLQQCPTARATTSTAAEEPSR